MAQRIEKLSNDFSLEDHFINTGVIYNTFYVITSHNRAHDAPPLFVKKAASQLWTKKRSEACRFDDIESAKKAKAKTGGYIHEATENGSVNTFRIVDWTSV